MRHQDQLQNMSDKFRQSVQLFVKHAEKRCCHNRFEAEMEELVRAGNWHFYEAEQRLRKILALREAAKQNSSGE